MQISITKKCESCGSDFSFFIDEKSYRQKSRRFCDACRYKRKMVDDVGVGARTIEVNNKKSRRKKPISISEMDRFAKSIGKSYGETVALIESGAIEYKRVPKKTINLHNVTKTDSFDIGKTNKDIFVKKMIKDVG